MRSKQGESGLPLKIKAAVLPCARAVCRVQELAAAQQRLVVELFNAQLVPGILGLGTRRGVGPRTCLSPRFARHFTSEDTERASAREAPSLFTNFGAALSNADATARSDSASRQSAYRPPAAPAAGGVSFIFAFLLFIYLFY